VREYGELMASAKVALPQSDDPQWGPVGNQLALERARQLERSKLGAEMRLLELQLACAADEGRSMPRDLRADLVSSIENLRGLQASCEPVGSTGSPQGEEVPR